MALSSSTYCNNWYYDTLQTDPNSEFNQFIPFHEQQALSEPELLAPHHNQHFSYLDHESFFLPTPSPYFDPTGLLLYPDNNIIHYPSQLLHYSTPSSHTNQLGLKYISNINEETYPIEDYNFLPCPKRQKCCFEEQEQLLQYSSSPLQEVTEFVVPTTYYSSSSSLQAEEVLMPVVTEQLQQSRGIVDVVQCESESYKKKGNNNNNDDESQRMTISAQSMAARERRRKITEKTQELGKLVPGGPKMNTAEMLHAAAKYVKYLRAQVGMLQLMKTLEEDKVAAPPTEDLHTLVVSPLVQEKLYSEERCFVPKEFVTTLTNHDDVRSNPTILKDLKQLILGQTDIEKN